MVANNHLRHALLGVKQPSLLKPAAWTGIRERVGQSLRNCRVSSAHSLMEVHERPDSVISCVSESESEALSHHAGMIKLPPTCLWRILCTTFEVDLTQVVHQRKRSGVWDFSREEMSDRQEKSASREILVSNDAYTTPVATWRLQMSVRLLCYVCL